MQCQREVVVFKRTNKQLLMHNDRYILLLQSHNKYKLAKLFSLHILFVSRETVTAE